MRLCESDKIFKLNGPIVSNDMDVTDAVLLSRSLTVHASEPVFGSAAGTRLKLETGFCGFFRGRRCRFAAIG